MEWTLTSYNRSGSLLKGDYPVQPDGKISSLAFSTEEELRVWLNVWLSLRIGLSREVQVCFKGKLVEKHMVEP